MTRTEHGHGTEVPQWHRWRTSAETVIHHLEAFGGNHHSEIRAGWSLGAWWNGCAISSKFAPHYNQVNWLTKPVVNLVAWRRGPQGVPMCSQNCLYPYWMRVADTLGHL